VAAAERSGDADEDLGAPVRGQRLGHGSFGGVDGAARLVGAGLGHAADNLAGVGRADVQPLAGLEPLTADQQAPLYGGNGHGGRIRRWTSRTSATPAAAASRSRTRWWVRGRRTSSSLRSSRTLYTLCIGESAATCVVFAASYPDRVERLVLFTPWARTVDYSSPRERDAVLAPLQHARENWGRRDFLEDFARNINP
jgi:hypothetical protein